MADPKDWTPEMSKQKAAEELRAMHHQDAWKAAHPAALLGPEPSDGGANTTIPVQAGRSDAEIATIIDDAEAAIHFQIKYGYPGTGTPPVKKTLLALLDAARALSRGGR